MHGCTLRRSIRQLADLRPGDHLCCLYETDQQFRNIAIRYIRDGLERNELVAHVVDSAAPAKDILGWLRAEGVDADSFVQRGQLRIIPTGEVYLPNGQFSPQLTIELIERLTDLALASGFSGLRGSGEMSWYLRSPCGADRLVEYEAMLNQVLRGQPRTLLCHYDRRRFDPRFLLEVQNTHPLVIVGEEPFENIYYVPPEQMLSEDRPAAILAQRIATLKQRHRDIEHLRASERMVEALLAMRDDIVVVVEPDGTIVACNPELSRRVGVDHARIVGRVLFELFPADVAAGRRTALEECVRTRAGVRMEDENGGRVFSGNAIPVLDDRGEVFRVVLLVRDITEQRRMEQSLRENQRRMNQAMDAATDSVWELDLVAGTLNVTPGWAAMVGFPEQATSPEWWIGRMRPGAFEDTQRIAEEYVRGKRPTFEAEYELLDREGQWRWIWTRGGVVERNAEGRPIRMAGVHCDVSARKRAETELASYREHLEELVRQRSADLEKINEELRQEIQERRQAVEVLRESEERYQQLLEFNTAGIVILDGECIRLLNPPMLRMAGYDRPDQIVGRSAFEFIDEAFHEIMQQRIERLLAQRRPVPPLELLLVRRDGSRITVEASGAPISYEGKPHIMVLIQDVDARKRAERALRESEKLLATGRLAAQVAHEINNPLAGIKNSFTLLKGAIRPDHPHHSYVGRIDRELERIGRIVRQMYQLYRPEREEPVAFDLVEAVDDALELLRHRNRRTEILFERPAAPLPIIQPESAVRQVVLNLVQNAVDASPPTREVRVKVAVGPAIDISVTDHGPGVPAEAADRIFEPFFTTKSGNGIGSGLGLGLSVSKSLSEAMGGRIRHEPIPGGGTVFHFELPAAVPGHRPDPR